MKNSTMMVLAAILFATMFTISATAQEQSVKICLEYDGQPVPPTQTAYTGQVGEFFLSVPEDGFIYFAHVDPAGKASFLFPWITGKDTGRTHTANNQVSAGRVYQVPDPDSHIVMRAAPPYGEDTFFFIWSPVPLASKEKVKEVILRNSDKEPGQTHVESWDDAAPRTRGVRSASPVIDVCARYELGADGEALVGYFTMTTADIATK